MDNKTKICRHCLKDLPADSFTKNKSEKDGLSRYCKQCKTLQPFAIPKRKACMICKKEKSIKHFLNEDTGRYSKYCHDCLPRIELMRYYKKSRENPDEIKVYHREYKRKYRSDIKIANNLSIDNNGKD